MKKLLFSCAAIFALGSVAMAADPIVFVDEVAAPLPAAPASTWDGLFVGVLGGYGWAQDGLNVDSYSYHDVAVRDFSLSSVQPETLLFRSDEDSSWASDNGDGWWGGGIIGYNIQSGNFVFGVEGDVSFSDIDIGSKSTSSFAELDVPEDVITTAAKTTASADINWYGTARVKAGYAMNNFLLYATGGLAFGHVELEGRVDSTHTFDSFGRFYRTSHFSESSTELGWTLGGGIDVAVAPNFIVGGFYRYVDLGAVSGGTFHSEEAIQVRGPESVSSYSEANGYARADANFHTVGVRAVYKFNTRGLFN